MGSFIRNYLANAAEAAVHRIGTIVGSTLAAAGLPPDDVQTVGAALLIVGGFVVDTALRKLF